MTLLLNVLWFIFGGWISGILRLLTALLLAVAIVGLSWAAVAFRLGVFAFAPFGRTAIRAPASTLAAAAWTWC